MASIYDKASLVLIPSGTKTSKVYSQVPTNGDGDFTFSRSTAATRVNASGNIEKETQNLLLQSNNFNTTWTLYSVTATSGQAGYDGSSDAWEISTTGVNGFENLNQNISFSGVHTISMYAKAGSNNYLTMRSLGTDIRVQFKLDDGTHSTTFGSPIDTFMEDAGGGWYRCGFTANFSSASEWVFYPQQIGITDAGNIYIQDAQLEQGLVARNVITTTTTAIYGGITDNVPRLDYTDSSCPALLLEPQRTNLVTQSEYLGDSSWSPFNATITSNYGTSPEGVQNSSRIVCSNTTDSRVFISYGGTLTDGTKYTWSGWYKGTAGEKVVINAISSGGSAVNASKVITFTGDWQRENVTFTAGTSLTYVFPNDARVGSDTTATDFEYFGAQLEAASYPTSYIPTYGSAVTRNGDGGTTNMDSLINESEGVLFLDYTANDITSSYPVDFQLQFNGTNGVNGVTIYQQGSTPSVAVRSGSTQVFYAALTSTSVGARNKIALAYKANDFVVYQNGVKKAEDFSGAAPVSLNQIRISDGTRNFSINQALLFKTRLSNEELAALTTI